MPDNDQKPPTDTRRYTSTAELAYARCSLAGCQRAFRPTNLATGAK
jgi:hypothetical protein